MFGFLNLDKSYSGTYKVDIAIKQPRDVACKFFAFLCFVFLGAAPIPHVQVAILNLSHATNTLINYSVIGWRSTLMPHSNLISKQNFLTCINYNANLFPFQMNEGAGMTSDATHHWVLL